MMLNIFNDEFNIIYNHVRNNDKKDDNFSIFKKLFSDIRKT